MPPSMKKELLELLEKDKEFRYAVIGYLGLDRIERTQTAILEEVKKLWEEVRALREGQERLWEENRKIWEEIKALREGQEKLWEEVRALREGQGRLWEEVGRVWRYVKSGFEGVREALGVSFEEYVASFIRFMLYELGYPEAKVEARKHVVYEGRLVELNVFSEEPLIVGEATLTLKSVEEAEEEVKKLNERVNIASRLYGKKPLLTILAVGNAPEEVIDHLKELTLRHGVKLIIGRELKEIF